MLADKYVTADSPYRGSASPPLHEQVMKFRKALSVFNSHKNGHIHGLSFFEKTQPRQSSAAILTSLQSFVISLADSPYWIRPVWFGLKWALRRERARPAIGGKASRQRLFHSSVKPYSGGKYAALFACRRLLYSASRRSRDTPQGSVFWALHPFLFISSGRGALPHLIPWHHDIAADKKKLVCCKKKDIGRYTDKCRVRF